MLTETNVNSVNSGNGGDWRDGFLFLGNHLTLEFLNTRPVIDGQAVEMLQDSGALARWMAAAHLITQERSEQLQNLWAAHDFSEVMEDFWKLRESLRDVIFEIEDGKLPESMFLKYLNSLLLKYPSIDQIIRVDGGLTRRRRFEPELPDALFAPLAESIADLLTGVDSTRIRKCNSCALHYYDTSKNGTRQWCSMNICGNRAKVAAFARRKRAAQVEK